MKLKYSRSARKMVQYISEWWIVSGKDDLCLFFPVLVYVHNPYVRG